MINHTKITRRNVQYHPRNLARKRRHSERKEKGLCVYCGEPGMMKNGKVLAMCEEHYERRYVKRMKQKEKAHVWYRGNYELGKKWPIHRILAMTLSQERLEKE